jgi:4-amino-4-deoxy-L-arabinose transferase-like glycosyltransferase
VIAFALLILWALLFLPNLRSNPNWYGDEGEWMDASWTLIQGHPRVDATVNDFLFPYPYPPLYLLINGALLKILGNDLLVGRALGAVTALGTAALLYWIGRRLRDRTFGFLCAAAFLVYPEAVVNYRWARGHTLCGLFVIASIGFLVRYVQEKRIRDVLLAGAMCSFAIATTYWSWSLAGAVVLTALFVNRKHAPAAALASVGYLILFLGGYGILHPGGFGYLKEQLDRLFLLANGTNPPSFLEELVLDARHLVGFLFATPTSASGGWIDLWLIAGTVGLVLVPAPRFRKWLILWLVAVAFAVVRRRGSTLSMFMYPATVFLPVLAIGVAGIVAYVADLSKSWSSSRWATWVPGLGMLGVYGAIAASGSFGHFRTKIDYWTQRSVADAEQAMGFVNANTTSEDFVVVPKQIYWLVRHEKKAMLAFCANYEGRPNEMVPVPIPREQFWFDCRWENAKFVVIAAGQDPDGTLYGFDAVCTGGLVQIRVALDAITSGPGRWPVAFKTDEYKVYANPKLAAASRR